jgi:crotonobetainyl-CoA:carnitine CoA-transferase CaiB-like acyl-CoA transferase
MEEKEYAGMENGKAHELEARIAALEEELQQLKLQRAQHLGRQPRPLDGVRVLDLSRFIFGPFCTQMLADMGAEVIKVEPRGTGDPARRAGRVFLNGTSASFLARNRNKRSIALDLRQPQAQDIVLRLADRSDVLIHNFRPGVMVRMGLDAKRVRERNPRLIYCSLSGYGQTGPHADWPGQDLLLQAMGGIISTTGWDDGPPVAVGTYLADVSGALTAAYGIVTALQARSQYGMGQELEVSLLDAMISLQSMESTVFLNSGELPPRSGSGHWMLNQPYGVFHTQDKDLVLNAHSDAWWARLCRAPEFAHLGADPRYQTVDTRAQHGQELSAALQKVLRTRTREAWLTYLKDYDVLCAPVYNYAELFADPQVLHNGIVVEQHHPSAGPIKVIGIPVKLSHTPGEVGQAAPQLGEHTRDILAWLGYDAAQIDRLHRDEVVSLPGDEA